MSVLTRIKNNQITDSTILANTKIVPGSIVGSLFNTNLTMTSDVTITGNLTVQGSSTYLTVASTNTYVNDPLIILNNAFSGTNTYDVGLLFNRGNQTTTALIWNEATDEFRLIYTTDDGASYGAINNSGYGNLHLGNLIVEATTSLGSLSTSGNISGWHGTLSGDLTIGGGDLIANTATFTVANATVTTLNIGGAATSLNMGATTGTAMIANPTLVGSQTTQAVYNTVATTVNAFGAATALNLGASTGILTANNANIWVPNATTIDGASATVGLLNNATTVNAFDSATSANIGAGTGTFTINNPTLVGQQPTQNLYNTVATAMNFAGAATSLNMGATSGTATINNATLSLPNAANIASGQTTVALLNNAVTTVNAFGAATTLIVGATTGIANIRNATTNIIGNATVGGTLNVTGVATLTDDLAVNGGDITTTASTFNLVNANATTVDAFKAATDLEFGATSGTLTINNPTVVGTQTTQNLYNTTATTLNFAGDTTSLIIGATTGVANIRNATTNIIGNATVGGDTTLTGDLAVNGGDLTSTATTFNLLNNTTLNINAFGAATDINIGVNNAAARFGIKTPNIWFDNLANLETYSSSIKVFNTSASTVNAFGAATTLIMGATTGVANIRNATTNILGNATVGGTFGITGDTTLTGDLAVNGGDITTTATTATVFNTNATTVDAFKAATDLEFGATTGTLTLNNPTVVGTQSTQALYNTTATTLNFAGAATTLIVGATTGIANIRNATTNIIGNATVGGTLAVTGDSTLTGDLAVNGGDITTTSATATVFNTNATTVDAFEAATTLNIGPTSGTLTLGNPTVVGTQATQNLYNTAATTLNFAGAATTLNIGADTGTVTINNDTVNLEGNVNVNKITPSTNSTSGALVVDGGVGIAGNLNVGQNVVITGNLTVQGDVTTLNTATLDVEDLNITVAKGAASSAAADGAGLTVDGASATILYTHATTSWNLNKHLIGTSAQFSTTLGVTGDTTLTANLAVNGGALTTSAGTFNLVNANATTLNLGGAATTIAVGATSGTITIKNPTLVGTEATQNLYNTAATTMNFAGAATTLIVGATTGIANLRNATTNILGNATVGGTLEITGNTTLTGDLAVNGGDITTTATTATVFNTNATTVDAFEAATTLNIGPNSGTLTLGNPTVVGTQATQALYNTTTTTLNFAGAVTTANVGAGTGTFTLNNPTLVGSQTTQNVYNTVATTVNAFGAATSLVVGATTGTLNLRNANIYLPNATTLYSGQSTLDIANVNVTTLSIGGAATALVLGATTGTLTLRNATVTTPGQIISTRAGSATTGDGQIFLNGSTSNRIDWNINGTGGPSLTTRSAGTKLVLYPALSGSSVDYAIGIDSATLWSSVAENNDSFNFKWFGGDIVVANLSGTGNFTTVGDVAVNGGVLTTTSTYLSLFNSTADEVDVLGAATDITIGAQTGVIRLRNGNIFLPNAANIASTQSTVAVFNTDTTTINAFGAATTLTLGATSGTASLRNANINLPNATVIYSGQTSLSLANTVTTTVNAFGAATTLNFASGTGSTTIRNSTTSLGILYANSATTSTSTSTGGLVVADGVGIGGNIHVAGGANVLRANITSTVSSTAFNNGALTVAGGAGVAGNISVKLGQQITVGIEDPSANVAFPDRQMVLIANANVASGINVRNVSSAPAASSNYFAVADNNVGESHFVATGIASSGFNSGGGIIYANDSYVINRGGNLIIAADPNGDLILATGGIPVLKYSWTDANITIPGTVISTSTTTGALTIRGGVGIGSNIWVAKGAVINDTQTTDNFRVKGVNTTSLIYADSTYGAVIIGGSNASPQLGATLKVNSTDSILLPIGATADRPSNSGNVDVAGMIRFNTSINSVEYYTGSVWAAAGSDTTFTIITSESFNGNGAANTYVLTSNTTTNGTVVSINGILQIPTLAYSITGNTLVFTENPADGDLIDVRILATTQTVGDVTSADGLNTFTPDNYNGAAIYSGTTTVNKAIRATAKPDGTWAYVNGTKTTYDQTATATSTTITVIDSFPVTDYSSAKYIVQTKNGSEIESMEALVVATSTDAYITTFGIVASNVSLGSLTANVVSGNVRLYYNTALTNSNVKVYTTYIV